MEARKSRTTPYFDLPQETDYSFANLGAEPMEVTGLGLEIQGITVKGEITFVEFTVTARDCRLELSFIGE